MMDQVKSVTSYIIGQETAKKVSGRRKEEFVDGLGKS